MLRWSCPLVALLALALPAGAASPALDFPSPKESVERMKLPKGFKVRLVAAEPDLIKPIAMTTDARGRLWVVESHSYPHWLTDGKTGKDRVLIFEPKKGGGWSRKVFLEGGVNLSGIAVGHGGVWLTSVPRLIFVPVTPGSDRPAGPAMVLLDGWALKGAQHNVVNTLAWGPDGWLYGLNGILSKSLVGPPGAPEANRTPIDCGVWRYHPSRHTFEAYAHGTTNPWGLDWDQHGELFITNCVIKHLFHVVPGAHFVRMFGQDVNPHSYGLIESCADHIHWAGGNWTDSRGGKGAHSDAGGGHAHAGAMFYLGDTWPAEYRNRVLMANLHGNRLNQNRIERKGSGYVARRAPDFLFAHDAWFRGLHQILAADGGMFVSDWHDTGECHNYDKTHPSGRVYHVNYGEVAGKKFDLADRGDVELVRMQRHKNDWWARQARLTLAGRATPGGKRDPEVDRTLWKMVRGEKSEVNRLRALWTLHAIEGADEKKLLAVLDMPGEHLRTWAVRLLVDHGAPSRGAIDRLAGLAGTEKSAMVRLAIASAMQKLPHANRWAMASALAGRSEDARDDYLPLMVWYGIEAAVPGDTRRAVELLGKARLPALRRNLARRLAALAE